MKQLSTEKTVYELINPSDKIYFDAETDLIATFCALLVGEGMYLVKNTNTGWKSSLYPFGLDPAAFDELLGMPIDKFINKNATKINKSLQSFRYANKRTSINHIVDYAHSLKLKE